MTAKNVSVGPLGRYIEVLELVAAFRGSLTLADASSMLDMPKTTAHRLLKGLVKAGLAKDAAGGRSYDIGERLVRLLHASADDGWLVALAEPHLRAVTEASAETCYLTRLLGSRVVVAVSLTPDVRWRGHIQPGVDMPVNAAATAKAIMAYQNEALVAEALSHPLPMLTVNTRNDHAWIKEELAEVRRRGYATCVGEIDDGLAAIAVPIVLSDGSVFHSLGMTGPLQRIMNDRLGERIAALHETAANLTKVLSIGSRILERDAQQLRSV
ncbi:IclR family transcriptional regulator C-terminal domain-containing protein [Tardiphaga sp.]|uniref:IclR family transcriptional regulator n=1 Tax=Tardiphaga sp. TaxID=1926292 RepID=UPI0026204B2A|nr:IclR family transcriptional regulator C-terminal domain-containing protein [Tardiphaga sp.]MDB5615913.1 regulatory protein IclR [Tardiphaga sp.]